MFINKSKSRSACSCFTKHIYLKQFSLLNTNVSHHYEEFEKMQGYSFVVGNILILLF